MVSHAQLGLHDQCRTGRQVDRGRRERRGLCEQIGEYPVGPVGYAVGGNQPADAAVRCGPARTRPGRSPRGRGRLPGRAAPTPVPGSCRAVSVLAVCEVEGRQVPHEQAGVEIRHIGVLDVPHQGGGMLGQLPGAVRLAGLDRSQQPSGWYGRPLAAGRAMPSVTAEGAERGSPEVPRSSRRCPRCPGRLLACGQRFVAAHQRDVGQLAEHLAGPGAPPRRTPASRGTAEGARYRSRRRPGARWTGTRRGASRHSAGERGQRGLHPGLWNGRCPPDVRR